jgi:hypothetical protein
MAEIAAATSWQDQTFRGAGGSTGCQPPDICPPKGTALKGRVFVFELATSVTTDARLNFLDIDPVGDFTVNQPGMVHQQDDLRIERFAGDNRPLQTSLGPVGSGNAVRVNELVATQHAVSEELGRLVEGALAGPCFWFGFCAVKPQNC